MKAVVGRGPNPYFAGNYDGETDELATLRRAQARELDVLRERVAKLTEDKGVDIIDLVLWEGAEPGLQAKDATGKSWRVVVLDGRLELRNVV